MIEAVVFDLDGTLLDTLGDLAGSGNYALSRLGCPPHDVEAYKYFVGNGADVMMRRILPEDRRTPEEIARIKAIFIEHYGAHSLDMTRPYDGVSGLLRALRDRGVRSAVVSNKPDDVTKQVIAHFFGGDAFDEVAGGRAGFPLKPDPGLTVHVLKVLGVRPSDALFVGDSMMDMQTAKGAGCTAVGVTWGFRPRDELLKNGADHIIDAPAELLKLI
ncbi:MAG: HAD family hydrolase [Synergistaceae bacterium]|jgi:phosphoglycolate phosphatase|nr:HAD family hydrolase [Synergistaceae bacterium]